MNVRLLKSKMTLHGEENFPSDLAKLLSVSRQTASAKLNGHSEFTQSEIAKIVSHYNLTDAEIKEIFCGE